MHLFETTDHKPTPCSSEIQKRVMRSSVMVMIPLFFCCRKDGNHAAAAANHISITDTAETGFFPAGIGIGLDKQFLSSQLCGAIKINGIDRLIGAEGNHSLHLGIQSGINHIAAAEEYWF